MVDQSNLRRGIKSANLIWGNEASVLAGDFLFAQSFDLMVETKSLKALSVLLKHLVNHTRSFYKCNFK